LTVRRALIAGLLLGFCFGVSMKSVLFLYSIALAALATLLLIGRQKLGQSWSSLTQCVAAFVVSTAIVPATIMIFFALKGLWHDFRYCVFDFNFLVPGASENSLAYRIPLALTIISALLVTVYVARRMIRGTDITGLAVRRGFVLMVCISYFLALKSLWPIRNNDDDPPFYPLAAVLCSGALLAASNTLHGFRWNHVLRKIPLPAFVALGEIVLLIGMQPSWKDR